MKKIFIFTTVIISVLFASCIKSVQTATVESNPPLYGRWTLERIRVGIKDGEDTMHTKTYRMIDITRDNKFITDPVFNPDLEPFTLRGNVIKTPTKEYTIIVLENRRLELNLTLPNNDGSASRVTLDYKR